MLITIISTIGCWLGVPRHIVAHDKWDDHFKQSKITGNIEKRAHNPRPEEWIGLVQSITCALQGAEPRKNALLASSEVVVVFGIVVVS